MARITVEDCLEKEGNRFSLVLLAAKRAKQLLSGNLQTVVSRGNRQIVVALREVANGKVSFKENYGFNSENVVENGALLKKN
jgi:DNA-directed RNA polymerase subunit omega